MIFKIIVQCLLISYVYSLSTHPILIVVSYDAFRYNFFDTKLVPNMERLKDVGTHADYLINVFPTKTFPNHHSIATGLYPDVHGVIGNTYYDPKYKKVLKIGYEMFHYNEDIKPIWRWNEDQGNGRYSGTMMWPGANYPYQGQNITYVKTFEPGYDWRQRVEDVISWITDPVKPANLVMLYFEEPDTHGHAFGPNSKTVRDLLVKLDNITLYLEELLEQNKLTDKVNVVHLSDHGMISVTPPYFINITQYITNGTYDWAGASPCIQIIPHEGYEEQIYNSLKTGSVANGHFRVYKKEEFPKRWNYKDNPRSPPILVMADVGYALDDLIITAPKYAEHYHFKLTNSSEFGVHGYDYNVTDMHPFFMARGPKIKNEHKVAPFHTVDLFNLFTKILELPHISNNGTLDNIVDILKGNHGQYSVGSILIISGSSKLLTVPPLILELVVCVGIYYLMANFFDLTLPRLFIGQS
ncbi:bis(5'-adenosyl)-triphosphatase enpp4 isoform X2 [Anoplophora glabripennis]|nr:bis(5'-adenosyl)-triphosphatase enpp4 isoform X2 [Anoplophora glabripennis]